MNKKDEIEKGKSRQGSMNAANSSLYTNTTVPKEMSISRNTNDIKENLK